MDRIAEIIAVAKLKAKDQVVQEANKVVKQHRITARALVRLAGKKQHNKETGYQKPGCVLKRKKCVKAWCDPNARRVFVEGELARQSDERNVQTKTQVSMGSRSADSGEEEKSEAEDDGKASVLSKVNHRNVEDVHASDAAFVTKTVFERRLNVCAVDEHISALKARGKGVTHVERPQNSSAWWEVHHASASALAARSCYRPTQSQALLP